MTCSTAATRTRRQRRGRRARRSLRLSAAGRAAARAASACCPFPLAAALITVVLIAAVAATLAVLGVRDWRCYGAAYLSIAVLHDVRLGALTPLLALGLALVWRWREQARAAVPLALIVVAKLFLWPLAVWLVATGRVRVALRGVVLAVGASALGWAVIGFAGLADYPKLLSVLAEAEQGRGYSLVSAGLWLGSRAGGRARRRRGRGRRPARAVLARGAARPRRALARARAGGGARALADRLAALLRAAARADRARAAHVRRDLADPGALLDHALRGALRRSTGASPPASPSRRWRSSRRRGRASATRTMPRDDALLEPREPRRRRPRHPVLPGRRLRRLRARRRGHLDR